MPTDPRLPSGKPFPSGALPAMIPGTQQRACPDREVGAARARVLRKRGEDIRFHHFTTNGHSRYLWKDACPRYPHAPQWSSAREHGLWFQREVSRCRDALLKPLTDKIMAAFMDPDAEPMGRPWNSRRTMEEAVEYVAAVIRGLVAPEKVQRVDPLPMDDPQRANIPEVTDIPPGFVPHSYSLEAGVGGKVIVTFRGTMEQPQQGAKA